MQVLNDKKKVISTSDVIRARSVNKQGRLDDKIVLIPKLYPGIFLNFYGVPPSLFDSSMNRRMN